MMTDKTKITLSDKEHQLVCNTEWILTKHHIIKKVVDLFGELLVPMQQETNTYKSSLPIEIYIKDPKISKGENYLLLPYIMLDYPRYFSADNTVAIRTMFWWGNFFSVGLLLSGTAKDKCAAVLIENFTWLQQKEYWICINENPWQHHFEADNFMLLKEMNSAEFNTILKERAFIKISKKISLQHWNTVTLFVEQTFKELINLLRINYLNDEKDL